MAATSGVNVLRYSALAFGIFYGFSHQRTVASNTKTFHEEQNYRYRESLIEQAKSEWTRKTTPQNGKNASMGLVTDPDDENFDLEAFLKINDAQTL